MSLLSSLFFESLCMHITHFGPAYHPSLGFCVLLTEALVTMLPVPQSHPIILLWEWLVAHEPHPYLWLNVGSRSNIVLACREPYEYSSPPFPEDLKALLPVVWLLNLVNFGFLLFPCYSPNLGREWYWCSVDGRSCLGVLEFTSLLRPVSSTVDNQDFSVFLCLCFLDLDLITNLQDPWQNQEVCLLGHKRYTFSPWLLICLLNLPLVYWHARKGFVFNCILFYWMLLNFSSFAILGFSCNFL